jgi:RecB family exonuclease
VLGPTALSRAGEAARAEAIVVPAAPARLPGAADVGRLSYTALADYERCAYRYYLQRVVGLRDVEAPGAGVEAGIGAAARGVLVHALLEQLDFGDPRPLDRQRIEAAAIRAGVTLSSPADVTEIAALAEAFVHSPLSDRLARCRELRREQPFAFALASGELLRGFIDVAGVEDDGTLLIVDYKTDWIAENDDLAAHVERDYSLQRLTYALAGLHGGAPRVEVAHCFLRAPTQLVTASYAAADRERLEASLRERVEPLRAGRFAVTAEPGRERCASCPGRARLCSYDESLTLRASRL